MEEGSCNNIGHFGDLELAKVHNSYAKKYQNVHSFQSILQPIPKLYKYSADQLQIIVHRRTGEIENISLNQYSHQQREPLNKNGKAPKMIKNLHKKNDTFRESDKTSEVQITDTDTDKQSCSSSKRSCSNVSNESEEKFDKVSISREDEHTISDLKYKESLMVSPSKLSTISSVCSSCDDLLVLLGDSDAECSKLRHLLDLKSDEALKLRKENQILIDENKNLKKTLYAIKSGLNGFTKSTQIYKFNEKRLNAILERASSCHNKIDSFKEIYLNLDKMKGQLNRISFSSLSSLSPFSFNLQNSEIIGDKVIETF